MKNEFVNGATIIGKVHSHKLELKVVDRQDSKNYGKEYIKGSVSIATDDNDLNVVTVNYTYVSPTFSSGKANSSFNVLKSIMENNNTVEKVGYDEAAEVRATPAFAMNDYVSSQTKEMVHSLRLENGFISFLNSPLKQIPENERNRFDADFLINGCRRVEADPDRNIKNDYCILKGAVFSFRKAFIPVEFSIRREDGMAYFESLGLSPSNILFTKVSGLIKNQTIQRSITEESAFGVARVSTKNEYVRDYEIDWAATTPYDFGDPSVMTEDELRKAIEDRNLLLAEKEQEFKERQERAANPAPSAFATNTVTPADFNF